MACCATAESPLRELKRSMENRQRGFTKPCRLSDGPVRAASLASSRVRLPYHVPYNGVRAHGLGPRFWIFFSAEQEAVCRVLRENTDNAGRREGKLEASQSRRPPHFRFLTTSTLFSARVAVSVRQQAQQPGRLPGEHPNDEYTRSK